MDTVGLAGGVSGSAGARSLSGEASSVFSVLSVLKPGISFGVALAGLAGMALAGEGLPGVRAALLLMLCILMASGGSAVMNVLFEADTDAYMPRVAGRADAVRRFGAVRAAVLAHVLILASLALSYFYINAATAILIIAAVVSYALFYTLYFKKSTPYGTVMGAIPGALPVLIGYVAVNPRIGADGLLLFLIMLMWQPPHFLALALNRRDEYMAAGIPVMPVSLGEPYTRAFMLIYASALPPLALSLWALGYCSAWFTAFAFPVSVLFVAYCFMNVVMKKNYGRAFTASVVYITAVLIAVIVDVGIRGGM